MLKRVSNKQYYMLVFGLKCEIKGMLVIIFLYVDVLEFLPMPSTFSPGNLTNVVMVGKQGHTVVMRV